MQTDKRNKVWLAWLDKNGQALFKNFLISQFWIGLCWPILSSGSLSEESDTKENPMYALGANKTVGYGAVTQTAGTVITRTVPPARNAYTHITCVKYTAAGTAHTVTVMRPYGKTTLSSAALAAQAVINLTADSGVTPPGAIAANDYLVIEKPDGTYHTAVVSSVAALAITLTANVPTGGFASGATVWFMGAPADHVDALFSGIASATTTYSEDVGSIRATLNKYEPMIVHSNNATAAGTLQQVSAAYSRDCSAIA